MPTSTYFQVSQQWDTDRSDLTRAVSNWFSPPEGGTISEAVSVTITWGITFGVSLSFEDINASLGGSYSEARTFGQTYTFTVSPGQTAQIIYIPRYHYVRGLVTQTTGGDIIATPGGPSIPTQTITVIDHADTEVYFPIEGTFGLAFRDVVVYDDSQYNGFYQVLPVGRYDWGQIHNDTISSLRVPAGRRVTLFRDTGFQGDSRVFTTDTPWIGFDFNDQTSSIIVE